MSGIAEILHNLGYQVQGSDVRENANTQRLQSIGIKVLIGHDEHHVEGAQVVVVSTAITSDNRELKAALDCHIPVLHRSEMLAELMRLKFSIAVSGTHGKTTITSLAAALLDTAQWNPTVINGGIINAYRTNALLGSGDWMVVEADESDGSLTRLPQTIGIITNIDREHLDHYGQFDHLKQAFRTFIEHLPFYGLGILCIDHPVVKELFQSTQNRRLVSYGFQSSASIRAHSVRFTEMGSFFDVDISSSDLPGSLWKTSCCRLPKRIKNLFLPLVGHHNVQNALSVIALAQELGIEESVIREAFSSFQGVKRRFTRVGTIQSIRVIDDYAHHPVEIQSVLKGARHSHPHGRILAVFQPHRYSRITQLLSEFQNAFQDADQIFVTPIYAAGELPIPGVDTKLLQSLQKVHPCVQSVQSFEDLTQAVVGALSPNDLVICLGAGDITSWAADFVVHLQNLEQSDSSELWHRLAVSKKASRFQSRSS
jgi:UDP-N-acetylmuramate--alanine ligase